MPENEERPVENDERRTGYYDRVWLPPRREGDHQSPEPDREERIREMEEQAKEVRKQQAERDENDPEWLKRLHRARGQIIAEPEDEDTEPKVEVEPPQTGSKGSQTAQKSGRASGQGSGRSRQSGSKRSTPQKGRE